jgi:hypothetical protein
MLKEDVNDMEYFVGERNYVVIIENGLNAALNKTIKDFNDFFKKSNINYEISEEDATKIVQKSIKSDYSGKKKICIHYEDIYEHLLSKKIFSAEEEISVYRIESKNNVGFYSYFRDKGISLTKKYGVSSNTVEPCQDEALTLQFLNGDYREKSSECIFGFKDLNALVNWITSEDGVIDDLAKEDLYLSEYKVKERDVLVSKKQVAFNNVRSRLVKKNHIGLFLNKIIEENKNNISFDDIELVVEKEITDFLKEKSTKKIVSKNKNNNI